MQLGGFIFLKLNYVDNVNSQADLTILAIGESTTFGYGIPQKDSYPNQLEGLLNEKLNISVRVSKFRLITFYISTNNSKNSKVYIW